MPAINRSFYERIKAKSYPDKPSCLVCGFLFALGPGEDDHYSYVDTRYRTGSSVCRAEDLEAWKPFGRKTWWNTSRAILYHPATGTCQLSGVTLHPLMTGLVPINEKDGYICGRWFGWLSPKERHAFVCPDISCPTQEPAPHVEWVAYFVHSRCWELLTHHDLGVIAEKDLGLVLNALRDRHKRTGYRPRAWYEMVCREDPVRTKCVTDAINLALEQEERRQLKLKKRKGYLITQKALNPRPCVLPMEILYMIFEYLPSQTVADLEKGLCLKLGNMFWYTRPSARLFYEVKEISVDEVDWKRLTLKLERRLEKSKALAIRRFLLASLDDVMKFVNV
ncbi:hypothetical protein ASPBRDRAFT_463752 [Aspergillus brasiliensis CBS 101740]|uniref:F-box domain-containing protein n=1 Tax=Aspergillus brasiliensis (strain CBS 101740 / IMI 381727 / IBT 21946) TaxID=767769 RepID=A0A1L9USX6_ASPBC|nr:hypothetical protein ASPBRDRAFT_463752 [Aspergillus brasiliensis CBS 101740]